MTTCPTCPRCDRPATGAIFLPSLAETEHVVSVCAEHDFVAEGDYFSLETMAKSPAAFLTAFDAQISLLDDSDQDLRGWLVQQTRGGEPEPTGLLTTAQAAKREGVSERTIQRWVQRRELDVSKTSDGTRAHLRIDPAELDKRRKLHKQKRKRVQAPTAADLF